MKKEKIISILKQYINTQLDTINTPIISFFKPVIKRIVDNNINKVNSFLDLIKDDNDEIDVIGLLEEMTTSLMDSRGLISASDKEALMRESDIEESISPYRTKVIDKVKSMYHYNDGRRYEGEKYDLATAKDVYNKYKDSIDTKYTCDDVYVAINAQYHDYSTLFHKWFNDIDDKIIKSAIVFWFMDEDYTGNKVKDYFKL